MNIILEIERVGTTMAETDTSINNLQVQSKRQTKSKTPKKHAEDNKISVPIHQPAEIIEDKVAIGRAVVKIKIFGVGGGGGSALKRMSDTDFNNIDLIAVNTDARALKVFNGSRVKVIQIGENLTKGRGTGGKVEIGELAAKNDFDRIKSALSGADMVFIAATMGGGTGTGAAPVIAQIAKELGQLTIGVVTEPFGFEGSRKQRIANEGIIKMKSYMDALVIVQNDNLMKLQENKNLAFADAFKAVDSILHQAIGCMAELILQTGFINVDFADVTTIFQQSSSSDAILGIGKSNISAIKAVQQALESPLIDRSIKSARGMILNITGDENLTLYEVNEAAEYIAAQTGDEVNIIFGVIIDNKMNGIIQAMVIATDFADSLALKSPTISMNNYNARGFNSRQRNIIPNFNFNRDNSNDK